MQLRDLVTVIITTSAIPSNPSTSVLEEVLQSFSFVPGLSTCDTILTCDGYVLTTTTNRESKFKSVRINEDELANYIEYQTQARSVFRRHLGYAEDASDLNCSTSTSTIHVGARLKAECTITTEALDGKASFHVITCTKRLGFALAVREALKLVTTPYVLIHQHDWTFLHPVDLTSLCHTMNDFPNTLHYIGFSSRRSLRRAQRPFLPPSIPQKFGPHLLAPLYFWYDKPHVGRTSHYRSFVFGRGRFQAGDFIEDTMGHDMLADLKARGIQGHADYGTWTFVYQDGECDGGQVTPTLRHRSGRHFRQTVFMRTSKKKNKHSQTSDERQAHLSSDDSDDSD
ncbi:hypothetical protein H310_04816 [Aphanomyces invadans]|uniref:Uncharacterized protein n=1 Tax=Aphanomyces invadans TaxID=157072 RepID=A0A024UAL8_9STRA|nr:hypothetical protein H310_04816 [Aphanomyces invadans]ETW03319.1 hypothetical protein H310_04816 [Aphanomyces invadans]|eukprot:XP_008867548.1 hypothetical protein H310_04816 [Aphanomyces invadans]